MKKENISLFDLRNISNCLLALAVKQLFPSAILAGGQVTSLGFYYDFLFTAPFEESFIRQIEDLVLAWVRQKMEVQMKEMVPVSAREYFNFHKEPLLAKLVEHSSSPTFFLMQFAGKMILAEEGRPLDHLGVIGAFHLQKSEVIGRKLRIHGTSFFDKKELKQFLKSFGDWVHSSHVAVGKEKGLFEEESEGEFLWFPAGQKVRSLLGRHFFEEGEGLGFQEVSSQLFCEKFSWAPFFKAHQKIFETLASPKSLALMELVTFCNLEDKDFSSGLFNPSLIQSLRSHVFCEERHLLRELISYLHFMTKIFKILDFEFQVVLIEKRGGLNVKLEEALISLGWEFSRERSSFSGDLPRVECRVLDGLGRSWPVSCVYSPFLLSRKGFACFAGSPCLSFERLIALMLEKKGEVPLWLSLEQVRVMPLQKKHRAFAEKISCSLKEQGLRSRLYEGEEELKGKLRLAAHESVPYAVVIGDKELEGDALTLRNVHKKEASSLPLQELAEVLNKQIKRELLL